MKFFQKKLLALTVACAFTTPISHAMDIDESSQPLTKASYKDLATADAKPSDFIRIFQDKVKDDFLKNYTGNEEGEPITRFSDEMEKNELIQKNLKLLQGSLEERLELLDSMYVRYAPGLLDPKKHAYEGLSEEQAIKAHELFTKYYNDIKNDIYVRGPTFDYKEKIKFDPAVSKHGDAPGAAHFRILLEKTLAQPDTYEKVVKFVRSAVSVDLSKWKKGISLPENPRKETDYSFKDAKASDVIKENPNSTLHILADTERPGGGVLKGTYAQEEMTMHATPELFLALQIIAPTVYPLKEHQALSIGGYVFSAMYDMNKDAPKLAEKYVEGSMLKLRSVAIAAALYTENLKQDNKNLIMGGAGCGVFGNDPSFISHVMGQTLENIHGHYDTVTFAILRANTEYNKRDDASSGLKYQPFMDLVDKIKNK